MATQRQRSIKNTSINRRKSSTDTLRMKEKYLKIPVDYNSSSLTDFRGLISKQRMLLDNPNISQSTDNTLLSKFKQLIGPKQSQSQYYSNPNSENVSKKLKIRNQNQKMPSKSLSVLQEDHTHTTDKKTDFDDTDSVISKMENNKPSQDYIRRFWMSDKNCSQCSECGATFHTFRRKHHCRLCGRVFCQTCCSERINISKFKKLKNQYTYTMDSEESNGNGNIQGMMRVCVFCSKLNASDRLLGIATVYPNNMSRQKMEMLQSTYNESVETVYNMHIQYVIKELCRFENLNEEWQKLIYVFSNRANNTVFPDILSSAHDFNDIRHYVKVKRIEGGNISECMFIDGVILRKNVAHRKMRTDIRNPKILLLEQAIEYHRMNSKFHSFDILLKQNEEYMRMIVNKIVDLGPDIVIVSNQVSRLALQEMMVENISLICNIDSSSMERIARAIRAPVIASIDHINQLESKYALGHCGHFYIKYYNIDPIGNKGRRTPLMFFDKCPANAHSTILLRGDKKINLLKVKNVIRLAMHALYHINLEKSFVNNLNLTFANIEQTIKKYQQIQTENEQNLFLSTSPFIKHLGWRRENVINKLKRLHLNKENDRFPHLQTYPYNHHGIGDNVNELGIWDPFLPNTDNPWICQTLLVNHCRVVNQQQCFPPKLKLIDFYTELDVSLGHFLIRMFQCHPCPNNRCKEPFSSHLLTYSHYNKTITIRLIHESFEEHTHTHSKHIPIHKRDGNDNNATNSIVMWSKCKKCKKKTGMKVMNDRTFFLSFGKFLEMEFYSMPPDTVNNACEHSVFGEDYSMVKCFGWNNETLNSGDMMVQIESVTKVPYTLFTSANITTNWALQFEYYCNELNLLELVSKYTFAAFLVKIDELIGLIGNYDIITQDLNKLRTEVNDECEKIATQFIQHREFLSTEFKPQIVQKKHCTNKIANPGTIAFLNGQRYHLYRLSSDWNDVLDGLRKIFTPSNEANVDTANRWIKRFKAPFKGLQLQSKREKALRSESRKNTVNVTQTQTQPSPQSSIRTNTNGSDALLDSALAEVDAQTTNIVERVRHKSSNNSPNNAETMGNVSPNTLSLSKAKSASLTPETIINESNGNQSKSFNQLLNLQNRKQTTAEFEQIISVISPRVRDVSFMVDFNGMFADHWTQNPLSQMQLKIPIDIERKYSGDLSDNNTGLFAVMDRDIIAPLSTPSKEETTQQISHLSLPINNANNIEASQSQSQSYVPLSPNSTNQSHTQLFPNTHESEPVTMQNVPTLNDVDMQRLKAESLFLVSTTESSADIGSNPYYLHLNLPKCLHGQIIPIYCDEPSAIIAYTLSSLEYHCLMSNIATDKVRSCRQRAQPSIGELEAMLKEIECTKRDQIRTELQHRKESKNKGKLKAEQKQQSSSANLNSEKWDIDSEIDLNDLLHHIPKLKHVSKMEFLDEKKEYQSQLKKHGLISNDFQSSDDNNSEQNKRHSFHRFQFVDPGHNTQLEQSIGTDTGMTSVSTTFSCHVYYPRQFRALRRRLYPQSNDYDFIESLSRCQSWATSGGKSGSTFKKTLDQRFVLKFVKQNEFRMFLDNAQPYFEHMASVLFKNYPSVLVHILGVYQMQWHKSNKAIMKKSKKYAIVMPNLWYGKVIAAQFDLKGALRNRYVSSAQTVKLDSNFIEYMRGFPMTLEDQSKQHLHKAVHNDTLFLCRSDVIDYSLLVGVNESSNELVVGVIDYLRTYTWDKAVEEQAKSIGMVIGKQAPTIQRPKNYKQRFREAMERYFMVSPDRKSKRISRPKDKCLSDAVKDILIHY